MVKFVIRTEDDFYVSFIFFFLFFDLAWGLLVQPGSSPLLTQDLLLLSKFICFILFEHFYRILTKFCLAAASASHRVREIGVPCFQPRAEWRPSVPLVGRLASGWWIVRESQTKLVHAGAAPPHHHIGGESCLGSIDQVPVDTSGTRVDHGCSGRAYAAVCGCQRILSLRDIMIQDNWLFDKLT